MGAQLLSRVRLFVTLWTGARLAVSMGFSRQGYWSGLPFPAPAPSCFVYKDHFPVSRCEQQQRIWFCLEMMVLTSAVLLNLHHHFLFPLEHVCRRQKSEKTGKYASV